MKNETANDANGREWDQAKFALIRGIRGFSCEAHS